MFLCFSHPREIFWDWNSLERKEMSRALDLNPGSVSGSPSPSGKVSSISHQELKDKDEGHGERINPSVPRPLETGLVLPAEGFESEFLLKRLLLNCFENAVTKAEQLVEVGAKKFLYKNSMMFLSHLTFKAILNASQSIFHTSSSCILTTYYFWPSQHFANIS